MQRYTIDPKNLPQLTKTDLARIDRMTDEDIDYSDIPPLGDECFSKEAVVTNMKKTTPFEETESSPEEDETTDFGRFTSEHEPNGEDELYAIIFDLVELDCLTESGDLDSWGIGSYERGIEALQEAGFVEIDRTRGRIYAKILPTLHKFKEWMEFHARRKPTP
jgi:hypothetical protein